MKFRILYILLSLLGISCGLMLNKSDIKVIKDEAFPKWLVSSSDTSKQTSGNIFIGGLENKKHFIIVDDIGKIHRLILDDENNLVIEQIELSVKIEEYFKNFPKKDFEEISLDKNTGEVYLSIEGQNPEPAKYSGIYKLIFENNDIYRNKIVDFEKINFEPKADFDKYLTDNIAYEGLAVDNKYFYLGLEGFSENNIFADSTIILIADKVTKKIVKEINTKEFGISTICGLHKDGDNLYVIDRNNKTLFKLVFDDLSVKQFSSTKLKTMIPGFPNYDYVVSFESVTMDDDGNLYLIDDPWIRYYVPGLDIQKNLDKTTINNFKKYIPAIFRYKII